MTGLVIRCSYSAKNDRVEAGLEWYAVSTTMALNVQNKPERMSARRQKGLG